MSTRSIMNYIRQIDSTCYFERLTRIRYKLQDKALKKEKKKIDHPILDDILFRTSLQRVLL